MLIEEAVAFLREQLLDGPKSLGEIQYAVKSCGRTMSAKLLKRARKELGIEHWYDRWDNRHYIGLPGGPRGPRGDRSSLNAVDFLLGEIRSREAKEKGLGEAGREVELEEVVSWVSEHLLDRTGDMKAIDIPNGRALALLVWAQENQKEFRTMYESKLIRSRSVSGGRPKRSLSSGSSGGRSSIDRLLKKTGT